MTVQQLNIKDAETIRLAQELADASGDSVTATIRQALEREHRAREEQIERQVTRVLELGRTFRAGLPTDLQALSAKEWMDSLYDEDGLPG